MADQLAAARWCMGAGKTERLQICSWNRDSRSSCVPSGSGFLEVGLHGGSGIPLRCFPNPTQECGGLKLGVKGDPSPSSLLWRCKKTTDFHPREDEMGYGSKLVLSDYFYPEHNLLLIATRLQEREFPVPEVISGIRTIQDSADSNIYTLWESMFFNSFLAYCGKPLVRSAVGF